MEETVIWRKIRINVNTVVRGRNNKMNENTNRTSNSVKFCAECPLCKYTRNCKKINIRYYIHRLVERISQEIKSMGWTMAKFQMCLLVAEGIDAVING